MRASTSPTRATTSKLSRRVHATKNTFFSLNLRLAMSTDYPASAASVAWTATKARPVALWGDRRGGRDGLRPQRRVHVHVVRGLRVVGLTGTANLPTATSSSGTTWCRAGRSLLRRPRRRACGPACAAGARTPRQRRAHHPAQQQPVERHHVRRGASGRHPLRRGVRARARGHGAPRREISQHKGASGSASAAVDSGDDSATSSRCRTAT